MLLPTTLDSIAKSHLPGWTVSGMTYAKGKSVEIDVIGTKKRGHLFLDPYTGEKLGIEQEGLRQGKESKEEKAFDFFRFIMEGHTDLWLPHEIGQFVSNYATLVFMFLLISGIVLWWPKNKSAAKQRFQFKWKPTTQWKRKNYDLHNILGFYSMIFLLLLAITGIRMGLKWVDNGLYWLGTGDFPEEWVSPVSDTLATHGLIDYNGINTIFAKKIEDNKDWEVVQLFPGDPKSSTSTHYLAVKFYQDRYYHYTNQSYWYDKYTLREVRSSLYSNMNITDKIRILNFDIHMGTVLDLPSKIIAAISGLIGASLPLTGFYIWWGRRNKAQKKPRRKAIAILN